MAKHTPQSLMGHPDRAANVNPPVKVNDPGFKPALGNVAQQLNTLAANSGDPGGPNASDPLDGQYVTNTDKNLF